jgi:hypothetical protein
VASFTVFVVDWNIVVSFRHTMGTKHSLEDDEMERQVVCDSNCCTEAEVGSAHNMGCEDEEDKELMQLSSLLSSWGPPKQHGRRGVNNFSGGAVGISMKLCI